jgi:uncharacterized membrane protein YqjE
MSESSPDGPFASLRGLPAMLVESLRIRLQLFAVEVEEEQLRFVRLIGYGAAAFFLLAAGLLFLAMFLTVLLWDEHRLLVLGSLTLLFIAAGAAALALALKAARRRSALFSTSIGELARDRESLDRQGESQ